MHEYEVRLVVDGRSTRVRVYANSAGAARSLAESQYAGSNVRFVSTKRVD